MNTITFGGVLSSTYDIYISGEGVWSAPERDAEVITIPGRNGAFVQDNGRFQNITVTYPAFIVKDTNTNFKTKIDGFRNAIASKVGYQRLVDTFHADEYRMAAFIGGLEVEPILYNDHAATFDLVFECKPQRYLTSGEEKKVLGTWGDTETKTGEIVELENDGALAVKSAEVALEPQQDTSGGVPSPSNPCPITGASDVDVNVADDYDDPQTLNTYTTSLGTTVYGGSVDVVAGTGTVTYGSVDLGSLNWTYSASGLFYPNSNLPMKAPTSAAERKTGIICSIYAPSTVVALDGSQDDKSILRYDQRVYIKDSAYTDVATFKTAMNGVQLVYELATPTTLSLTPTQVDLISGTNYVFSPQGEITLEYGTNPNYIVNPTLFGCGPLIEAKGYGDIQFNGHTISLSSGTMGTITLGENTSDVEFSTGTLNNGDPISVKANFDAYAIPSSFNVSSVLTTSVYTNPSSGTATIRQLPPGSLNIEMAIKDVVDTFTAGTDATDTFTAVFKVKYVYSGVERTSTITMNVYLAYNATAGRIKASCGVTANNDYDAHRGESIISKATAVSSVSLLGDPTYIDCDLGEAYKINDGEVVGLNSFIDLGSKLPELAPGINEFTVSNTFTEVAVTPRWWTV